LPGAAESSIIEYMFDNEGGLEGMSLSESDGSDGSDWPGSDGLAFVDRGEVPEPPSWLVEGLSSDQGCADASVARLLDVVVSPDDAMAWAAVTAPGGLTAEVLAVVDRGRLSEKGRTDLLIAVHRQQAWTAAQAHQAAAIVEAKQGELSDPVYPDGKHWVVEQVRTALRVGGDEARTRLLEGVVLTQTLPATLALLESGAISDRQATRLVEEVIGLNPELVPELEGLVLARAAEQSYAAFRRSVIRARAIVAPKEAEQDREQQMTQRRVVFTPRANGMSEVWALLPSEGAQVLHAAVRALAGREGPTDTRKVAQREADGLIEMATWVLHHDGLPREQGLRPQIQITMTLETLLGLNDLPAELDGIGPIPSSVARRLAHDPTGTWRRLIVDPINGRCLDYGRSTYTPPAQLREHSIAVHRTCIFPGCHRHARRCDLDHHQDWNDLGETSDANIGPLCPRHHHLKHDTRWQLTKTNDGYTWTDPTGHTYTSRPDPYPITPPEYPFRDPATKEETTTADQTRQPSIDPADDPPPF
jgi:Domain of unknown function (DUF222)